MTISIYKPTKDEKRKKKIGKDIRILSKET